MAKFVRRVAYGSLACLIFASCSAIAGADTLQSAHYKFDESTVGSNGMLQSNSLSYQLTESVGDAAVGNSSSSNYQVQAGSKTTPDPALTFSINNGTTNFGSFTPSSATVTTSTFSVIDYTSYGYSVLIIGSPPTYNGHTIAAMASTGSSTPGIEQFGINLVANTSPSTFGADPNHGQFGVGSAAPNYATPNKFRYVSGETIASAPKSSGQTTYTISYLINVSSITPSGKYVSNQDLICIPTY